MISPQWDIQGKDWSRFDVAPVPYDHCGMARDVDADDAQSRPSP